MDRFPIIILHRYIFATLACGHHLDFFPFQSCFSTYYTAVVDHVAMWHSWTCTPDAHLKRKMETRSDKVTEWGKREKRASKQLLEEISKPSFLTSYYFP